MDLSECESPAVVRPQAVRRVHHQNCKWRQAGDYWDHHAGGTELGKAGELQGFQFVDAKTAVTEAIADARKHSPDIILIAAHAGLERDLKTGAIREGDQQRENMVYQVASDVPGIDAIVFGH